LLGPLTNTIHGVFDFTWPMLIISVVVLVSLRVSYLVKNHEHFVLYKEFFMLIFVVYTLCLFQVVTFQDDISWSSNNFVPFREILRYNMGSRLFFKNVVGNLILFMPYGFFVSYYLKNLKPYLTIFLTVIASFSIESVQMVIGRVFDIDDILLNILGGYLGYLVYYFLGKIGNILPKVFKSVWFLNIFSILLFVGFIVLLL